MAGIHGLQEAILEKSATFGMRRAGIIESSESLQDAAVARRDALRATWALRGHASRSH